jgi:hypothetical protein
MLPPIYVWLRASQPVQALIGQYQNNSIGIFDLGIFDTGIFDHSIEVIRAYRHGEAPQDTTRPYVTWSLVAGVPDNELSSVARGDRYTVQVDCWHQTDAGIEALAKAVRNAIEPNAHMTGIILNNRDPQTKLYRIALQFDVLQSR